MNLVLVAAVAANNVIGRDNDLVWRNPDDLRRLKALTLGGTLLMGRRTFESIGHPLPGRQTLVLTRSDDWSHPGVRVANSLEQALEDASGDVFIFGGADLYAQLIDRADRLEITHVDASFEGDAFFPSLDLGYWQVSNTVLRDGFRWVTYRPRVSS